MNTFRKWVLGAGIFNIGAAFPLALPVAYKSYYALLNTLNEAMGLGGQPLIPPTEGMNMLAVNTAGSSLTLVGVMLIYAAFNLEQRAGIPTINAIARILFAVLVVYYTAVEDTARILLVIAGIDVLIAIMFLYLRQNNAEIHQ